MALNKRVYVNGETVITAENLNAIQDEIISNAGDISLLSAGKVDVVAGKELSTNDFTDALKSKLDAIEAQANKTVIDSSLTNTGQAADAKAAGDGIKYALKMGVGNVDTISGTSEQHYSIDELLTPGTVRITTMGNAGTVDTLPVTAAGRLFVCNTSDSNRFIQIYVSNATAGMRLWVRSKNSTTAAWTDWKEIITSGKVETTVTTSDYPISATAVKTALDAMQTTLDALQSAEGTEWT